MNVQNDFFELGGDSLSAIALQVKLAKEGIELNKQEIYDNSSARKIFAYIDKKSENTKNNEYESINLEQVQVKIKEVNNIFLTGATGFLGIHILNELLEKTNNNIYCIIRETQGKTSVQRLKDKYLYYFNQEIDDKIGKRLFIITGDLIQEQFGLNREAYIDLTKKINIVINTAASVKHYGKKDYNYEHNVISTKNLISFSEDSNAMLNHISTVGIAGNNLIDTNNCIKNSFSEEDLKIGQAYNSNVYVSTKLQAEELIIKKIQETSIKANIIRVGNLMNRYSDNMFQDNKNTNAFQNKIREIINIGYIPSQMQDFTFDLTPVDLCANAIIKVVLYNQYNNVYHVLNNQEIGMKEIKEILVSHNIKIAFRDNINETDKIKSKWLVNDFLLKNKQKININSIKTQKILKELGFSWKNDMSYYIRVFKSIVEGDKDELRQKFLKIRKNIKNKKSKSDIIITKILETKYYKNSKIIALYYSLPEEVNTIKLINKAIEDGKIIILPKICDEGDLQFYKIKDIRQFAKKY